MIAISYLSHGWVVFHCILFVRVCVCAISCLCIHLLIRHLGCFCTLAIVSDAAVYKGCMYLFEVVFCFSQIIPRSRIYGSCDSSIFSFSEKHPYCFPYWQHQFTLPATVSEGSFFSTSSPVFAVCVPFDVSRSDRYELISQCIPCLVYPLLVCWWI